MRVGVFLCATSAVARTNGTFSIEGGGFTILPVPYVPWVQAHLALAVRLDFEGPEADQAHEIEVAARDPTGRTLVPVQAITLAPLGGVTPSSAPFVLNYSNIRFPAVAEYSFALTTAGTVIASTSFIVVAEASRTTLSPEIAATVNEGLAAFVHGNSEQAAAIFRGLTAKHPDLAPVYNNLGFVLLTQRDAAGAKRQLDRARDLGFDRTDILTVNLACSDYLSGRYREAAIALSPLRTGRDFAGSAILLLIAGDDLVVCPVANAGEYQDLVTINAAWSALQAGNGDQAAQLIATITSRDPGVLALADSMHSSFDLLRRSVDSATER